MKNLIVRADNVLVKIISKISVIETPDSVNKTMEGKIIESIEVMAVGIEISSGIGKGNEVLISPIILSRCEDVTKEVGEKETKGINYAFVKIFDIQAIIQ